MRNELYHYGVKGMKWGVRRYQNKDGTWTSAGKARYGVSRTSNRANEKKSSSKSNKSDMQKKVYKDGTVGYVYRDNNPRGRNNFDKVINKKGITVPEISEKITAPTQKAIRIFANEPDADIGANKAITSLKKDLGDWDFSVSFERYPGGYASGTINIIGND